MRELEDRLVCFIATLCARYEVTWADISDTISTVRSMQETRFTGDGAAHLGAALCAGGMDDDAAQKLVAELLDGIRI
jgi:hypothetical protein